MDPLSCLRRNPDSVDAWIQKYGSPESVADFHLYCYEWIDFHDYTKSADEVLRGWPLAREFVSALQQRWKSVGWAGDGEVTALWLPPFVVPELETTQGLVIWHVKQLEDGISWIASKHPLKCLGDEGLLPEPEDSGGEWPDDATEYKFPSP